MVSSDPSSRRAAMPQTLHPVIERHYTVAELARLWQLDQSTVRRVFQDEPGVLKLGRGTRGKRAYVTLRIPESVAERVHRERSR